MTSGARRPTKNWRGFAVVLTVYAGIAGVAASVGVAFHRELHGAVGGIVGLGLGMALGVLLGWFPKRGRGVAPHDEPRRPR